MKPIKKDNQPRQYAGVIRKSVLHYKGYDIQQKRYVSTSATLDAIANAGNNANVESQKRFADANPLCLN